ncbi:hypothetical protein T439DRAFT_359244 [Meredithblackwellia eburnea MCA 4105]
MSFISEMVHDFARDNKTLSIQNGDPVTTAAYEFRLLHEGWSILVFTRLTWFSSVVMQFWAAQHGYRDGLLKMHIGPKFIETAEAIKEIGNEISFQLFRMASFWWNFICEIYPHGENEPLNLSRIRVEEFEEVKDRMQVALEKARDPLDEINEEWLLDRALGYSAM